MIILGVDLGRARTGLSICDKQERLAVPCCTISERREEQLLEKIAEKAEEREAEMIVFGLPKNMDGSEGESAVHAREFAQRLEELTGLETVFFDERGTTITAYNYLNDTKSYGKKRRDNVDMVAATIILQNYLDYRKNSR